MHRFFVGLCIRCSEPIVNSPLDWKRHHAGSPADRQEAPSNAKVQAMAAISDLLENDEHIAIHGGWLIFGVKIRTIKSRHYHRYLHGIRKVTAMRNALRGDQCED